MVPFERCVNGRDPLHAGPVHRLSARRAKQRESASGVLEEIVVG